MTAEWPGPGTGAVPEGEPVGEGVADERVLELVRAMPHEVYAQMRESLELGRWSDGRRLTEAQRRDTLAVLLLWERMHSVPFESHSQGAGSLGAETWEGL